MIGITVSKNEIEIIGHAGYGKNGNDIICSAVSALVGAYLFALTEMDIPHKTKVSNGYTKIYLDEHNSKLEAITTMFVCGIVNIHTQYPEYVSIKREDSV